MRLNGEVFEYKGFGSTFTTYGSTLISYDSTIATYDSTITTYDSTYVKNVLELILIVKFWAISIILYIYHPNKNLQINSGLKR